MSMNLAVIVSVSGMMNTIALFLEAKELEYVEAMVNQLDEFVRSVIGSLNKETIASIVEMVEATKETVEAVMLKEEME
jgi:predicted house-cleaning noncanonical NTP pyrophosphatase (MazG superfamily)